MQETTVRCLGQEPPLEKGMAIHSSIPFFFFFGFLRFFFKFYFIFKLYNIVLVLPYIEVNPPQAYICSPSWTLLPPPSPYHPSGSSQCTPVFCLENPMDRGGWQDPWGRRVGHDWATTTTKGEIFTENMNYWDSFKEILDLNQLVSVKSTNS